MHTFPGTPYYKNLTPRGTKWIIKQNNGEIISINHLKWTIEKLHTHVTG